MTTPSKSSGLEPVPWWRPAALAPRAAKASPRAKRGVIRRRGPRFGMGRASCALAAAACFSASTVSQQPYHHKAEATGRRPVTGRVVIACTSHFLMSIVQLHVYTRQERNPVIPNILFTVSRRSAQANSNAFYTIYRIERYAPRSPRGRRRTARAAGTETRRIHCRLRPTAPAKTPEARRHGHARRIIRCSASVSVRVLASSLRPSSFPPAPSLSALPLR